MSPARSGSAIPDEALAACSANVADWSGGTRIASSLHVFNKQWARRVLGQGAVVLLITDGLERDADDTLAFEIDRLHRSCKRLIWLNPLLRFHAFEARAKGVQTMLPHVDELRPIHNLDSMKELVRALSGAPAKGLQSERSAEAGCVTEDFDACRAMKIFSRPPRNGAKTGASVALATVVETWGSAPRPVGSNLVIDNEGNFLGSVSGGCVEGAVVTEAMDVIESGKPKMLEFGVADETAWKVGLSCGGTIRVYVEKVRLT